MNAPRGKSGLKLWRARVQDTYSSLAELRGYNAMYAIAKRCGYRSCLALWNANPVIQGSVNPADFGLAPQPRKREVKS